MIGSFGTAYRAAVTYGSALVIIGWIVAAVLAPRLNSGTVAFGTDLSTLVPPHSEAVRVKQIGLREFRLPLVNEISVVIHDPDGLTPIARADAVAWALSFSERTGTGQDASNAPHIVGALPVPLIRNDVVVTYLYISAGASPAQEVALGHQYARHFSAFPGVQTYVTGLRPAQQAQHDLLESNLNLFRILSVAAVALIVTIAFRSVLAAVLVLAVAGVGYLNAEALLHELAARGGFAVPDQVEPLIVALVLGVVTDYSMLFFQDLREQFARGLDHGAATRQMLTRQAPVVTVAGLTVAGGTAALLVARLELFRAFGPALVVAVLVGLVVSLTLTPALLTVVGHRLFRPGGHRPEEAAAQPRKMHLVRSVVAAVSHRSSALLIVLVAGGALLVAAAPLLGLRLGASLTASLPPDDEARQGMRVLAAAGVAGVTAPTEVIVQQPGVADARVPLGRLQHEIAGQRGVAVVYGPADNLTPRRFGVFLAQNGDAARLVVAFHSDPLGADAIGDLRSLKGRLGDLATSAGLHPAAIGVTGQTAIASELTALTATSLIWTLLAAMGIGLLIIAIFLRALVAAAAVIVTSALTVGAALGLTTWLFQDIIGAPGLTFYAPFATAVLLLSLESDYNVFAVGNIFQDAEGRTLRGALRSAVPRSSRAISAAGFILATTMGALAVIPIETMREVAFTMAVGLLIDTLVVRPLIVPAILTLLGPVAGWPSGRIRRRAARPISAADAAGPYREARRA